MSVVTKAMQAAARLAEAAQRPGATSLLRSTLDEAGQRLKEAAAKFDPKARGTAPAFELPCFGKPMSLEAMQANLAGLKEQVARRYAPQPQTQQAAEAPPAAGAFVARSYTGPSGTRAFRLFRPVSAEPPRGLLVMLHGCTQSADDFAAGTRMNSVAQAHNLLVVYPEQTRSANSSGCWNWFEPRDQGRDKGEPGIIAGIARSVMAEFGVAPARTFVAGLSAGGAMAAILAETYPDLFAAVGIHSGLAYGAARDIPSAFAAMQGNGSTGRRAEAAEPLVVPTTGVPLIVFQGDADRTVNSRNADAIVARFQTREQGLTLSTERGTAPGGEAYARVTGRDREGATRFEHWTVVGAGHAWSGGSPAGSYTDPAGPDASAEMMRFFLQQVG